MRGARLLIRRHLQTIRIIPAYAGSTMYGWRYISLHPDHPRICGEHSDTRLMTRQSPGSSPHMRGARRPGDTALHRRGIIPAYAGSTLT